MRTWSRLHHENDGMTLVELLIAMFILAVGLMALASVTITTLVSLRITRDREQATNAASAAIEDVRTRDFRAVGHDPSVRTGCSPDGEPIVSDPAITDPVPGSRPDQGNGGKIDVEVYVTWAQDDDHARDGVCDGADDERTAKRVVAVATWSDRDGQVRTVRQESLIAAAQRGLPVPDFRLSPSEGDISFDPSEVTSDPVRQCIRHQLRNVGAADTYDWQLEAVQGAVSGPLRFGPDTYHTPNGKWQARAYLQYPATDDTDTPPDPAADPTTQLMRDDLATPADSDLRPESSLRVSGGHIANLWICYRVISSIDPDDPSQNAFTATVAVRSRFDAERVERLTHHIAIGQRGWPLYLFDVVGDDADHPRDNDPRVNHVRYPPHPMGPENDDDGQPEILGTSGTLPDYDSDVDVDRLPGLRLIRSDATLKTAMWHEQFTDDQTILEASGHNVRLWVATTGGLGGPGRTATPETQNKLQIQLQRLHRNENTVQQTFYTTTVTYSGSGWIALDIPITLSGEVTFGRNEYLRLAVTCLDNPVVDATTGATVNVAEDCHVAYDQTQYASAFTVAIR